MEYSKFRNGWPFQTVYEGYSDVTYGQRHCPKEICKGDVRFGILFFFLEIRKQVTDNKIITSNEEQLDVSTKMIGAFKSIIIRLWENKLVVPGGSGGGEER